VVSIKFISKIRVKVNPEVTALADAEQVDEIPSNSLVATGEDMMAV